jgi:heme exporter protein D
VILNLGPYAGFIIAAYAVALGVVVGLIVWIVADHRAQQRTLKDLEARGIGRRSAVKEVA